LIAHATTFNSKNIYSSYPSLAPDFTPGFAGVHGAHIFIFRCCGFWFACFQSLYIINMIYYFVHENIFVVNKDKDKE